MSGELVAFYQAGYGVAAFGVAPLRDLTGSPLGIIYVFGSMVAAAMLLVALAVVARAPKAPA
jgi:prolipoprotein diacylglyceryltransferase